jgi:hypothetical protein
MISSKPYSMERIRICLDKAIDYVCQSIDSYSAAPGTAFTRNRIFTAPTVMNILIQFQNKGVKSELCDFMGSDIVPTDSAFCQQRQKLDPEAMRAVLLKMNQLLSRNMKTLNGYRLLACDGSDINIPHNSNDSETYHQTRDWKGYNQLHLNALYDVLNEIYQDVNIDTATKTREAEALIDMVRNQNYPAKSIIICDRGYEKYNLIANLLESKQKFVIRVKDITSSTSILAHVPIPDQDEFDIQVTRVLTYTYTKEIMQHRDKYVPLNKITNGHFEYIDDDHPFYKMQFRVVRFKITEDTYECLITNLKKSEFSAKDLKMAYHYRWSEENGFRQLKWEVGMVYFHSRKRSNLMQEIYASLVMFNFTRYLTINTEIVESKDRKYDHKANFVTAITNARLFIKGVITAGQMKERIKKFLIPVRSGRSFKRSIRPQSAKPLNYKAA